MASCTKIMTALLFCERVQENAVITVSQNAASVHESSAHLKPGERLTASDLLRAMLLRSANDGCVAAAEKAAGSEPAFVQLMNERAAAMGCSHTHFANPHGLTAPGHYTSARDLSTIARAAMQVPRIRQVVCLRKCRIQRTIDTADELMRNHSHFLGHFPGADGVKTGWTIPAGHCYVGSATEHGWELISVVLHSPNYVQETEELMRYGFSNYRPDVLAAPGAPEAPCPVTGGSAPTVPTALQSGLQVVFRRGKSEPVAVETELNHPTAPIQKGAVVGVAQARVGSRVICSSPILAARSDYPPVAGSAAQRRKSASGPYLLAGGLALACLVSLRYGGRLSPLAKGSRRRRGRLA